MSMGKAKSDLGMVPEKWKQKPFAEVFDFLSTTSFSRNQLHYEKGESDIHYIHYGDIHTTYSEEILDLDKEQKVPVLLPEIELPNTVSYLQDGDLIIADASEDYEGVGECIEVINVKGKKIIGGLHTFVARSNGDTSPGFRAYIFRHPVVSKELKKIATGSNVYGISKTNLAKLNVVLPSLPEQQKIASILRTWDKAIEKTEKLLELKQQHKKGLMQLLLTGKKRFPGFSGEWEEVKLENIATFKNGKAHEDSVVDDGKYVLVNSKFISTQGKVFKYAKEQRSPLKSGDIVMVMSDVPNGKALAKCYIIEENHKYTLNQRICSLKTKNANTYFIYLSLNRNRHYMKFNDGVGQTNLKKAEVLNCPILLPSKEEQDRISEVVRLRDIEISALHKEVDLLKQQKKGLMQVLLTGKVRVEY